MTLLLITVRFLDERYHGLLDREGTPEWPPSPYRLLQALVAGVANRDELLIGPDTLNNRCYSEVGKAIGWLQQLSPPTIVSPKSKIGRTIINFVPNNDGDKKFDRQNRLTARPATATLFLLEPSQKPEVHYVWDISDCNSPPLDRIRDAARSLTSLGWGIDMAFADAKCVDTTHVEQLQGIRWYPKANAWRNEGMLRTPTYDGDNGQCTLCDLRRCHHSAMSRIQHGRPLKAVDKPSMFDRVLYSSIERPVGRPIALFELKNFDGSYYRYSPQRAICLAGMVRHLAIEQMTRLPPPGVADDWVKVYVAGHGNDGSNAHQQISYIPLPSIGHRHADPGIRRVMIAAPFGDDDLLNYIARRLSGLQLVPKDESEFPSGDAPLLVPMRGDNVTRCYTAPSATWYSFTPVILDGHVKRKAESGTTDHAQWISKALERAGIEQPCDFEWSAFSMFSKSLSAHKYDRHKRPQGFLRPSHLKSQTAVHLTIRFHDGTEAKTPVAVPGPIAIGAGRHCGLGTMASPYDA